MTDDTGRGRRTELLPSTGVFLLGLLSAACAAWISRALWDVGGVSLPWGLVLATLAACALALVGLGLGGRAALFAAIGGWAFGVLFWLVRPGEVVIASDGLGYAFLLLPTAGLLAVALVARRSR